jgi:hypothetical protein
LINPRSVSFPEMWPLPPISTNVFLFAVYSVDPVLVAIHLRLLSVTIKAVHPISQCREKPFIIFLSFVVQTASARQDFGSSVWLDADSGLTD